LEDHNEYKDYQANKRKKTRLVTSEAKEKKMAENIAKL
jgi:hypothetical protein